MTKRKRLATFLIFGILFGMSGLVRANNVDPPEIPTLPPPVTIVDNWNPETGTGSISITANRPILIGDPGVNVKIFVNGGQLGPALQLAFGATYTADIIDTPGPPPHVDIDIWSPNAPPGQE